jgi:hypothetical protein
MIYPVLSSAKNKPRAWQRRLMKVAWTWIFLCGLDACGFVCDAPCVCVRRCGWCQDQDDARLLWSWLCHSGGAGGWFSRDERPCVPLLPAPRAFPTADKAMAEEPENVWWRGNLLLSGKRKLVKVIRDATIRVDIEQSHWFFLKKKCNFTSYYFLIITTKYVTYPREICFHVVCFSRCSLFVICLIKFC